MNAKGERSACLPNRSSPGIGITAKKKMVEKITAIDEPYHIGDTLVFLEECEPQNVALNGRLLSEDPRIQEILQKISA